ncbi:MAG: hypothetical protein LN413_00170 [Candidatus Thermoplasmatota archaeon]|nr:hypothetical protein [Candidatus Thermoplasmatota archaeon]
MTATLHEIEFLHESHSFMVSGEIDGSTDAPNVEIATLLIECADEFKPLGEMGTASKKRILAAAEDALIQAAEDRRLIYSCGCCAGEFYGRPPECPACEEAKEAVIARARGK